MQAASVTREAHSLIASDRVEGTPVRRPDGEKVGTIDRLMIDKISGKVAYAVLRFGGFLGMGEKHLPLPWTKLHYNAELLAYELTVSDDELNRAPSYREDQDFDWGSREREREVHAYHKIPPYWGI
jgi:hypothetical protein